MKRNEIIADIVVMLSIAALSLLSSQFSSAVSRLMGSNTLANPECLQIVVGAIAFVLATTYGILMWRFDGMHKAKTGIILLAAILYTGVPMGADMLVRAQFGVFKDGHYVSYPHDGGVLQTEAAIHFLTSGKNPYSENYATSFMAESHHSSLALWRSLGHDRNPAFAFYPYPPGILFVSAPIQTISDALMGWYDQRVVYLGAVVALCLCVLGLFDNLAFRRGALALCILNPIFVQTVWQGYNDILCVVFIVASVATARREAVILSCMWLAISCGMKQFAWILVPFHAAYVVSILRQRGNSLGGGVMRCTLAFVIPSIGLFAPFLIWDASSFLFGLVAQNRIYPIREGGLGFTSLLLSRGIITNNTTSTPWTCLASLALPVAIVGIWRNLSRPSLVTVLAWFGVTLLTVLYFSRFFASNYLLVPFTTAIIAAFLLVDEHCHKMLSVSSGDKSTPSAQRRR